MQGSWVCQRSIQFVLAYARCARRVLEAMPLLLEGIYARWVGVQGFVVAFETVLLVLGSILANVLNVDGLLGRARRLMFLLPPS